MPLSGDIGHIDLGLTSLRQCSLLLIPRQWQTSCPQGVLIPLWIQNPRPVPWVVWTPLGVAPTWNGISGPP